MTLSKLIKSGLGLFAMACNVVLTPGAIAGEWRETFRVPFEVVVADGWVTESEPPGWFDIENGALKAGVAYLYQNTGLAMMRLPSTWLENSDEKWRAHGMHPLIFDVFDTTAPVILAKYDSATATGVIDIVTARRLTNGDVVIVQKRFAPDDAGPETCNNSNPYDPSYCDSPRWLEYSQKPDDYGLAKEFGYNPFWEFRDVVGQTDAFVNITLSAFLAAVGAVVVQTGATGGWVALLETRTKVEKKTKGGLLRKKVTVTLKAYTKPRWVRVLHPNLPAPPTAKYFGFRTLWGDNFYSKSAFVFQGKYHNYPVYEVLSYQYSKSKSAWTGFAMFLFSFAVGSLLGWATLAQGVGPQGFAQTLSKIGSSLGATSPVGSVALGAGVASGMTNTLWNMTQGVGWSDTANRVFATGRANLDVNNLGGGFDWRKGVYKKMMVGDGGDTRNTPGAIGELGRNVTHGPGEVIGGPNLHWTLGDPKIVGCVMGNGNIADYSCITSGGLGF